MIARQLHHPLLRRFSANFAAQGYSMAVTTGTQLLLLPAMLIFWGAERYGAWLIVAALPTYLAMADLGFAQIAANEMTMLASRGDRQRARVVNQTAWLMILMVTLVLLLAAAAFSTFFPIAQVFQISGGDAGEVPVTVFLLAGVIASNLVFGVVGASMRATGLYWLMVSTTSTLRLFDSLVLIAVAALGYGFTAAAAATLGLRVVLSLAVSVRFYARYPEFRPSLKLADWPLLRRMIAPSLAYMSLTVSTALNIQGANLIVGAVLGPTAVVVVSAIRTLTRLGRMAASVVVYALEPIFAELKGREEHRAGQQTSRYLLLAATLGSLVYAIGMLLFGETFLHWWTHGIATGEQNLFRLMVLAVVVEVIWYAWQTPYVATNRHSLFALWYLGLSVAGVLLLAPLLTGMGLVAAGVVAAGVSGAMLLVTFFVTRRHDRNERDAGMLMPTP